MIKIIILLLIIFLLYKFLNHNLSKKNDLFKLSDNIKITKLGKDIYIVDNFYKYPELIRKYALKTDKKYSPHTALYKTDYNNPNLFYNKSNYLVNFFEKISRTKINEKQWNKDVSEQSNGFFQFITNKSNPVIHHDLHWGVVVYLTPSPKNPSGTSLYKHKETNVSHIEDCNLLLHKNKIMDCKKKVKDDLWVEGNNTKINKWKIKHQIKNKFNRAIIFDGRNYHASDGGFGNNINNSRLYQTFFFSPFENVST